MAIITLMMEAVSTPEIGNFYHTTRRNNPEGSHLHQILNRIQVMQNTLVCCDTSFSSSKLRTVKII
jgi:hypothetical protein